jgi:hypothetical protein
LTNKTERPEYLTDEMLVYLDDLRDSGVTNMFGAGPYVSREFILNNKEASKVVAYWMDTFSERHAIEE